MSEHAFLQHLREDHEEQKNIAAQLIDATDPDERNTLRQKLYDELYPHIMGEEASIFPRLREAGDQEIVDDALEGLQEHHVAKFLLRELMDMSTESAVFKAKATVLDETNRHHLEEEEDDIFSHLKSECSDSELDELFEKYEAAEEKASGS